MPLHAARHKVQFLDDADIVAPVTHDLAFALHRSQTPCKRDGLFRADVEQCGQFRLGDRHAALFQRGQNKFTTRQWVLIKPGFALVEGVALVAGCVSRFGVDHMAWCARHSGLA